MYGPGRYRFFDFTRVGGILTLIVFVGSMLLIPVFWPLHAKGARAPAKVSAPAKLGS